MKRVWILPLWASLLAAQRVPDSYIVELAGDPAAVHMSQQGRRAALEQRARIRAAQLEVGRALEEAGAQIQDSVDTVANALFVRIPDSEAWRLAAVPGVRRVHAVRQFKLLLDHALPLHGVPEAWQQIGGMDRAGAGIKIAIPDTGIDRNHPGFQDPSLPMPPGYPKFSRGADQAFTSAKVIVARSYEDDPNPDDQFGHGTAVAMAAAGVPNQGPLAFITGVAPKAYLGNYKVSIGATQSAYNRTILKALDDALADGMDVINLSFGDVLAARPSDDIVVDAIERASAAGVIVVVGAGNGGPDPNTMGSPATAPSAIAVGASGNDRALVPVVNIEGAFPYLAIPGTGPAPDEPITAPLADVATLDQNGMACGPLPEGSLAGRIALILRGVCYFADKLDNAQKAGALAALVYTDADRPDADFIMNVGDATLPAMLVSYMDGMDIKARMAASPDLKATMCFIAGPYPLDPNRVASFSSRGPNPDLAIKPDLLAVGTWVYTATQKTYPSADSMYDASGYILEDGTSFSAPLVAGAAAVLKAARPGLTVQQYRSLLINTASTLRLGILVNPAPVQRAGTGLLNLPAALESTATAFPASLSFGVGNSTMDLSRDVTISNVGAAWETFSVSVQPIGSGAMPFLSTNTVQLDPGKALAVTLSFTGTALEPGEYQGFVQVQGATATTPVRIPYWYAVPSSTPRYLTVLYSEEQATVGRYLRNGIVFRVTDPSGIALLDANPAVTATSGGGVVNSVRLVDNEVPGAYTVNLTLGLRAGENVFQIQAGNLTQDVTIEGTAP
jgi:hypothetical protein